MKKILKMLLITICVIGVMGCDDVSTSTTDTQKTIAVAKSLEEKQPTPTDIEYSLERYNLIRRAY